MKTKKLIKNSFFLVFSITLFSSGIFNEKAKAAVSYIDYTVHSKAIEPVGTCELGVTLSLPEKPKAIVVLVHGSGAIDRHGTIPGGYTTYKDIADKLSLDNIAAVRFDKRSSIPSCAKKMNSPLFTHHVFIEDALTVIGTLSEYEKLNKVPKFLLGHSQGVNFVTELAQDRGLNIDGVILAAGLGNHSMGETLVRQLEWQAKNPQLLKQAKYKSRN